jgi:hypothetical protein
MDPSLMAMCLEVLDGDVDSDHFADLLIETGVNIDQFQWSVANRLLEEGQMINSLSKRFGKTVH